MRWKFCNTALIKYVFYRSCRSTLILIFQTVDTGESTHYYVILYHRQWSLSMHVYDTCTACVLVYELHMTYICRYIHDL